MERIYGHQDVTSITPDREMALQTIFYAACGYIFLFLETIHAGIPSINILFLLCMCESIQVQRKNQVLWEPLISLGRQDLVARYN